MQLKILKVLYCFLIQYHSVMVFSTIVYVDRIQCVSIVYPSLCFFYLFPNVRNVDIKYFTDYNCSKVIANNLYFLFSSSEPPPPVLMPGMPELKQQTREETSYSTTSTSSTTFMQQSSTVVESKSFSSSVIGSDGTTDTQRHSTASTATSQVHKATGQPTVEVSS